MPLIQDAQPAWHNQEIRNIHLTLSSMDPLHFKLQHLAAEFEQVRDTLGNITYSSTAPMVENVLFGGNINDLKNDFRALQYLCVHSGRELVK